MELAWSCPGAAARFADRVLTLQSGGLERVVDFTAGAPKTRSIALDGVVIAGENAGFDADVAGLAVKPEPRVPADVPEIVRLEALDAPLYDHDAALIEVETFEALRQIRRLYRYVLYPGLPMIGFELEIASAVVPQMLMPERLRRECLATGAAVWYSTLDTVTPAGEAEDLRTAEFRMRTDFSNELVRLHRPDAEGKLAGSILETRVGGIALVMFQEAPPPNERREWEDFDFLVREGAIKNCGLGFTESEVTPGRTLVSHRGWFGAVAAPDAAELVRRFYRRRLPASREGRYAVTVNPWGSGSFYERINEAFLLEEIRQAGRCGADIYQIDDGYQQGGVLADLTWHNRVLDHDYWHADPVKLPRGMAPLADAAREAGVELSLWFAPSSNREFCDYEESADILLAWYKSFGIRTFKLDAVRFTSYAGERNFIALLRKLYEESAGGIMANLDVTNGVRGGVGHLNAFGTLFLENRYVFHDRESILYHPVRTLRNLWNLSRFVPTPQLQIEVANPDEILPAAYAKFSLPTPDEYDFRFWCGVALFASPLLWFQPSRMAEARRAAVAEVMAIHRRWRGRIFSGDIRPIGSEPGQGGLTGFAAESGFVIIYRTREAAASAAIAPPHKHSELLYATGPAELAPDGTAALSEPGTFALWRIEKES